MKKQLLFKLIQFFFRKILYRLALFIIFTFLTAQSSFAQKWSIIGNESNIPAPSNNVYTSTTIAVVGDVPYVSYIDGSSNGTARVKKRNTDGTWSNVGSGTPFGASVSNPRIFSDNAGKLYVMAAYKTGGYLYVSTLDTNAATPAWVSTNITGTISATYTGSAESRFDMAFDSNNVPYIAYSERNGTTGYPWVKKYDSGTSAWVTVGTGAVQTTDAFAAAIDIAIDANNVPYLVYIKQATTGAENSGTIKTFRFISSNWEDITPVGNTVGTTSTVSARYTSITMDKENNPVVCYFNTSNSNKSTIIRYNKTTSSWDSPMTVSTRDANSLYMTIDTAGNLYNIFTDNMSPTQPTLRVFKQVSSGGAFTEMLNIPVTTLSGVGIDNNSSNNAIAVGTDTSKPYIVYTKLNSSSVMSPVVRFFLILVTTKAPTNITSTSATTGGDFKSDGTSTITERGIVYGTAVNPTITDTKITDTSTGVGSFTTSLTGLSPATNYNVRAYSIDSNGVTTYGNNETFSTLPPDANSVTLIDNGTTVVMNNGIVKATINKSDARVTSLIYNGLEMLKGNSGAGNVYWSWNMDGNYQEPTGCTYTLIANPNANNFEFAEIKLRMTYDAAPTSAAMDVDVYYSLPKNASGLYASATLSHPAAYPALSGGEWRMASSVNDRFNWLSVDALRNRMMPSATDAANSVAVDGAPKEVSRYTTGIYTNKYECKYDYSADFGDTDVWGWSSTADNVGIWVTAPSKEYYPGGPMKRELMSHGHNLLLNMIGGTHYGQGHETAVAAGEEWQKNYGPFLIYCNKVAAGTANAPIALWENAKTQAKTEQAVWPYSWHNNPSYVKESGRGTVTGKLVINDSGNSSASAADTWVGLAIPPTGSSSTIDFQDWSKNYQFWVKTDANGNFSIPDVLPGTYSLFAFGPGANGQLSLSNYATVSAGNTTALGNVNWTPIRVAPTIWEIGKPDRNAMEFKHGTDWWTSNTYPDARWGIFMNYPDEFPNDVNFTIGQSNIATDWNFVHYWDKNIRANSPEWKINFNLAAAPNSGSTASVYVAVAEANGAALILSVNGTNVTSPLTGVSFSNSSNSMVRKGIHGAFNEVRFDFPASYLKAGANQISFTLRVTGGGTLGNIMYDYVRLEANLPVCNAPTFTSTPTNINTATAANSCDAVVNYTAVASENPTYGYVLTGATTGSGTGTGSGSKFNKGTTHVVITATNSCGNVNCSFDIIVSDSTKPTIIAPQNIQISTTNSNPVTGVQLGTPTVADNCSATNNLTVTNNAPSSFPQGTTTVTWTVTDESGNFQTATQQVVVTMNTAPTAVSDQISVSEGATSSTLVGGATNVLANDTDSENNTLTTVLVSNAANGILTLNSNGTFSYVHNGSETTSDSFTYKAYDGVLYSNIVTVNITVAPVNDAPIATADVTTVAEGGTVNGTTVLANDTDAENNTLTAVLVSNVTNGTLTLNSNGTFSYVHNGSETTSDSFTYKAYDGIVYSNVVTVNITVTPVNDTPIATTDAISVANGGTSTALVGNGTTVLVNDTDAENNTLTAVLVSNVTNGILTLNPNGTFSYVHNGSSTTSDSFTYKANDGTANSNVVTVNITIAPFTLANNNFTIESKSETCANKNNGEIIINALNSYNYVARINGTNYPLVNNSLTVSNLAPGAYSVCITITGKSFEQCFAVTIGNGGTITGKSTISSDKVAVEITEGTAPYQVYVNGTQKFETEASSFTVDVKQGDLLEVKTAKVCEGVYSKSIDAIPGNVVAYPNPTQGWVEITVPTTKKEVPIELYASGGQLISRGNYTVVNEKTQLNLDRVATGTYLAKVYIDTPVSVKIIKY